MADSTIYYSDISKIGKDFVGNKDISTLTNEQALLESVKNILSTEPGERVMNPTFGCNLSKYLFNPLDRVTMASMKIEIQNAIGRFENRIEKLVIDIKEDVENSTIEIVVMFNMKTSDKVQTLKIQLNKIR